MSDTYVGIDVSKARLDVAVRPSGEVKSFDNDEAGFADLVTWLSSMQPKVVVLEATGGFEAPVAFAMANAGLSIAVLNPRQIRDFGRALGKLAKTDRLDSEVIALFAEATKPEPRPLPDEGSRELAALVARRKQLSDMIVAERNRLGATNVPSVREDIQ